MVFGKCVEYAPLLLNDSPIAEIDECKYLGVNVLAGKDFSCSNRKPLSNFYCSANTILNVLHGPSELVQMQLLYTNCVPLITYCCEIKRCTGREMTRMDVALNDCTRKIFSFNRWESTRYLRQSLGYKSITEIYAERQQSFRRNLPRTRNPILIYLAVL